MAHCCLVPNAASEPNGSTAIRLAIWPSRGRSAAARLGWGWIGRGVPSHRSEFQVGVSVLSLEAEFCFGRHRLVFFPLRVAGFHSCLLLRLRRWLKTAALILPLVLIVHRMRHHLEDKDLLARIQNACRQEELVAGQSLPAGSSRAGAASAVAVLRSVVASTGVASATQHSLPLAHLMASQAATANSSHLSFSGCPLWPAPVYT